MCAALFRVASNFQNVVIGTCMFNLSGLVGCLCLEDLLAVSPAASAQAPPAEHSRATAVKSLED